MSDKVTAQFYLVVEGQRRGKSIIGLRADRMVKSKPSSLKRNEVSVRVSVSLPVDVFRDFEPEVNIDIPGHLVTYPVEIEANDPGDPIPVAEDNRD